MANKSVFSREKIEFIIIFSLAFSLYFSVMLYSMTAAHTLTVNPLMAMKIAFQYGFPWKIFIPLFFLTLCGCLSAIFYIVNQRNGIDKMGRNFKMTSKRKSYGESHFEEPHEYEDVAIVQRPEDAYGTILGKYISSNDENLVINYRMDDKQRTNSHIAIVGASGSGKTYTFVKNYIYQCVARRESGIFSDPKGELYEDMVEYLKSKGYIVRIFNLKDLLKSDGWHCMKAIRLETAELDAQMFAQVIISNISDDTQSIYGTGPMSLLKALILRVYFGHDYPEEKKNIAEVYNLLQNPAGEAYLDEMFDPATLTEEEMPCLGPWLSFKQGSPNLRGNLITHLSIQLQLLQSKTVQDVLTIDDIDLELPGKQPCAYFCVFPDSHDTYRFIISLFFSMLFIKLIDLADNQPSRKLAIPTNFLLDEFPSIGILPDWDRKMSTIRSRGISVAMIYQNIGQLQNLYEKSWSTILSNCATQITLGINDQDTADFYSRRIGETTIEARTDQHGRNETFLNSLLGNTKSHSTGEGRRSLVSYDEAFKIDKDECIIIFQGHDPILAKKYPYIEHPEFLNMPRDAETGEVISVKIKDLPNINTPERMILHAKDKERVNQYLLEHPLPTPENRKYKNKCIPYYEKTVVDELKESLMIFKTPKTKTEEITCEEENDIEGIESVSLEDEFTFYIEEPETISVHDETENSSVVEINTNNIELPINFIGNRTPSKELPKKK